MTQGAGGYGHYSASGRLIEAHATTLKASSRAFGFWIGLAVGLVIGWLTR